MAFMCSISYISRKTSQLLRVTNCLQVIPCASKHSIYEINKKSGYGIEGTNTPGVKRKTKKGIAGWTEEFKKLYSEKKQYYYDIIYKPFLLEPKIIHADFEPVWTFDGKDSLDGWSTVSDKDHTEGYSDAFVSVSKNNKLLFSGFLSTEVPANGVTEKAGYVNLKSPARRV